MLITHGKHTARRAEWVVFNDPHHVILVLETSPLSRRQRRLRAAFERLVRAFDRLPLTPRCAAPGCPHRAVRASVYRRTDQLRWWCPDCDETCLGAAYDKLEILWTYRDVERYAGWYAEDGVGAKGLIQQLARAKGLPDRATVRQQVRFFSAGLLESAA